MSCAVNWNPSTSLRFFDQVYDAFQFSCVPRRPSAPTSSAEYHELP
jgi:hypothetical protein